MKVRFLAVGLPGNRPILATALALKFDIQQATINQPARQVLNGTAGPLIWLFDVIDWQFNWLPKFVVIIH